MQVEYQFMFVTFVYSCIWATKTTYTHRYLYKCLFVLVLFRVMIVLVFYFVDFILCKSLTRDEGCKLALCYMPYIHGIG